MASTERATAVGVAGTFATHFDTADEAGSTTTSASTSPT
jgi:hypothetical protein